MSPIRRLALATAAATMLVLPAAGAASAILPDGYDGPTEATDEPSITMMPAVEPALTMAPLAAPDTAGVDGDYSTAAFTDAVRTTVQSMPWFSGGAS